MGVSAGENNTLLDALLSAGIPRPYAERIAQEPTFAACSVAGWMIDLEIAARLMNQEAVSLDCQNLLTPWNKVCPALISSNGVGLDAAMLNAVSSYDDELQIALVTAVGTIAQRLARTGTKAQTKTGPNAQTVQASVPPYLQPIDPTLIRAIRLALERGKGSKEQKKKLAGEILTDWLRDKGEFIHTPYGGRYYLYKPSRQLYSFDTQAWSLWLYYLTSINPASDTFKHLTNDCELANMQMGKQTDVVRVAHWDNDNQILRVSRFDGTVYRLDGMTIEEEGNGDGPVLFDDATTWTPYRPDYTANGTVLDWALSEIPRWDADRDTCNLIYRAWWLATFFTELCPTRPILVLKGAKGAGKSMSLRVMLRLLFGIATDVVGVPERADAFTALTSNSHIVAIDNMDDPIKELRDKIASLSTGKIDQVRKLYTTNESITIRYRCWLALTSRSPETLQRSDLIDRTLILPVKRVEDDERIRESYFLTEVMRRRNQFWGDLLSALNSVVWHIRQNGVPNCGGLRMEDWAALGTVIAQAVGQQDIWEKGLKEVKVYQRETLLGDNVVAEAIEAWLSSPSYMPTFLSTRTLYEAAKSALFDVDRPDSSWPRSAKSFGRQLADIRLEFREYLSKSGVQMQWRTQHGLEVYRFEKRP